MLFKSAVDWWFYLVAFGIPIIVMGSIVAAIAATTGSSNIIAMAVVLVVLAGICSLPIWLLLSTGYRVDSGNLVVRSGPVSWVIPLDEIQSVRPSRSLLSSPALSINRIEIDYGTSQHILISPKDSQAFLEAIGHPKGGA